MVSRELSHGRRLDDLISRIQSGETTIEEILREEDLSVHDLGPLLATAAEVREAVQPARPRSGFLRNSEIRILNKLRASQRPEKSTQTSTFTERLRLRRLAPVIAGLLLALSLTGGMIGVGSASAASLPGDTLYPFKQGIEEARLILTFDDARSEELMQAFVQERLAEIEALAQQGRLEDLAVAVEAYTTDIDRLMQSSADEQGAGPSIDPSLAEDFSHNVEVLQGVLGKVPPQAQDAIQRAIDRSMEHAQEKEERRELKEQEQELKQEEQEQKREEKQNQAPGGEEADDDPGSIKDQRQAEQIARKYNVSLDEVYSLYEGVCAGEWNCVRAHYREQNRRGD